MYNDVSWTAGQWVVMMLMMLIFWGGLAALVVWLMRNILARDRVPTTPVQPPAPLRGADDLLAERFARGEIDEEEFARRRQALHSG